MNSERLWILVLALVCFLAGLAGGLLAADRIRPHAPTGPFAGYVASFADTFDLDEERTRDLRFLMDRYHRDIEDLKARHVQGMEDELIQLGDICRDRIKTYVLPVDRHDEYDLLAAGFHPPGEDAK